MKYFCADLHADRFTKSVLARPFENALEMSEYLIDKINTEVNKNDILYLLGDIAFSWKETTYWRSRIKCRNIFVTRGNHDISIGNLRKIFGACFVDNILETSVKDLHLVLCHYPFLYWNQSHHNSACLHGHLHDQRTATYMNLIPEIRLLDVSFESAKKLLGEFRPFTEDEIYDILSKRKGHDDVQFYKDLRGEYLKSHI